MAHQALNLFGNKIQGDSQAIGEEYIAAGSTRTMTANDRGKTVRLDTLTGSTVVLPASTGSGHKYKFYVSVLATSNNHIVKVANSSDAMQGILLYLSPANAASAFAATAGTSDTITLNRTTTGSVTVGEWFQIEDVSLNKFQVTGVLSNSGTAATPFSATV